MTDQDSPWKELFEHDLVLALELFTPDITAGRDPARDAVPTNPTRERGKKKS